MVARINTSKNISKALNYNEQKLKNGTAQILSASGFLKDVDSLSFYNKLNHFERLIFLNDRTVTNTLHISLNFDPTEQFSKDKLIAIADSYMEQIGFSQQPYLVYNHFDAGHPHIHIVSTNIQRDGKRISMHNIGRNQSETARKEIEKEFGLIKADSKRTLENFNVIPVNAQKVIYGKSVTKRAIANVLMMVLNNYKYISLPELNAVLILYNVMAETGQPGTRLDKFKGLVYRVLDANGHKIGTPIKASAFYMKPTLTFLEKKFVENEPIRIQYKKRLQASITWELNKKPGTLNDLVSALEKQSISLVVRTGKEGVIYGLTYVDHKTKTVFNGSDLGKQFSAKSILELIDQVQSLTKDVIPSKAFSKSDSLADHQKKKQDEQENLSKSELTIFDPVISKTAVAPDYVPSQLKKKKRKKRKRISI